jgi:hypothetical protein
VIICRDKWQAFSPGTVRSQSRNVLHSALYTIFNSMEDLGNMLKSVGLLMLSLLVIIVYVAVSSGDPLSPLNNGVLLLFLIYPIAWAIEIVGKVGLVYMEDIVTNV